MNKNRNLTFSGETILESRDGKRLHFMPGIPYEVSSLRVDYDKNEMSFVCDGDFFEFVPVNDAKIELVK